MTDGRDPGGFLDDDEMLVEMTDRDRVVVTRLGVKDVVARMRSDAAVKLHSVMDFAYNIDRAVLFDPASGNRVA